MSRSCSTRPSASHRANSAAVTADIRSCRRRPQSLPPNRRCIFMSPYDQSTARRGIIPVPVYSLEHKGPFIHARQSAPVERFPGGGASPELHPRGGGAVHQPAGGFGARAGARAAVRSGTVRAGGPPDTADGGGALVGGVCEPP